MTEMRIVDCTNSEKVANFRRKFGLPNEKRPVVPSAEMFLFRYGHVMEEMTELLEGYRERDVPKMADALADILYLTYGTAHECGIPIDAVFAEVHRANMRKVRATGSDDPLGKRGSRFDVVKPPGWQPPDVAGVIREQTPYVSGIVSSIRGEDRLDNEEGA